MSPDDFWVAKCMESDDWTYIGLDDTGEMVFTRIMGGVTYSARVGVDR